MVCLKLKNNGEFISKVEGKFYVEVFVVFFEEVVNLIIVYKEIENVRLKFVFKILGFYNIIVKINGDKFVENLFIV